MGIVHRDLKPDNVVVNKNGTHPRMIDFGHSGICRVLVSSVGSSVSSADGSAPVSSADCSAPVSSTDCPAPVSSADGSAPVSPRPLTSVLGTPPFVAPEICCLSPNFEMHGFPRVERRVKTYTNKVDIWSFGLLLLFCADLELAQEFDHSTSSFPLTVGAGIPGGLQNALEVAKGPQKSAAADQIIRHFGETGQDVLRQLISLGIIAKPSPTETAHLCDYGQRLVALCSPFTFSRKSPPPLWSRELQNFFTGLLAFSPSERLSAADGLRSEWFAGSGLRPSQDFASLEKIRFPFDDAELDREAEEAEKGSQQQRAAFVEKMKMFFRREATENLRKRKPTQGSGREPGQSGQGGGGSGSSGSNGQGGGESGSSGSNGQGGGESGSLGSNGQPEGGGGIGSSGSNGQTKGGDGSAGSSGQTKGGTCPLDEGHTETDDFSFDVPAYTLEDLDIQDDGNPSGESNHTLRAQEESSRSSQAGGTFALGVPNFRALKRQRPQGPPHQKPPPAPSSLPPRIPQYPAFQKQTLSGKLVDIQHVENSERDEEGAGKENVGCN
uniref:non-specific serine/threonine protein kinase n=1 Tax=Chromera velia CCMP2878 TaxID=1169474 RepID=A0A0G4GY85_9ALVE|eukprot:Cvel_23891.t1-p1 / transcript=Cvel_23891.t1 / gene=Cvel_23891 / organism=Chromera_velia_CCMP2878 / gene_product=hypothetical protein / transcript_product=hypothetical protein / location=Cvel_scaffold2517:9466-14106(-) / protein_length=552 / sequence_SO=supercontig / SO=protein_coding / is_pseudo=false